MSDDPAPFRLLRNAEFERLTSQEKSAYVVRAAEYLRSLVRHPSECPPAMRYAGPERRRSHPGIPYDGPERRAATSRLGS
jgi:hypothetical protein